MATARKDKGEWEFTGRHFLIVMICFFGTVIGVNMVMAVVANRSWTGLVAKNGYVESQHFNQMLEAARKQKALGWTASLVQSGDRLVFTLVDRDVRPVHVTDARLKVSRPTHEGEDREFDLVPTAQTYEAEASLDPGVWNAVVTARRVDGEPYRAEFRLVAKSKD